MKKILSYITAFVKRSDSKKYGNKKLSSIWERYKTIEEYRKANSTRIIE